MGKKTKLFQPELRNFLGEQVDMHIPDSEDIKKICQAWSENKDAFLTFEEFHRMFDYITEKSLQDELTTQDLQKREKAWKLWTIEPTVTKTDGFSCNESTQIGVEKKCETVELSEHLQRVQKETPNRLPEEKDDWGINLIGALKTLNKSREEPLTPAQIAEA